MVTLSLEDVWLAVQLKPLFSPITLLEVVLQLALQECIHPHTVLIFMLTTQLEFV